MADQDLQAIQRLQFHDPPAANQRLKQFLNQTLPFRVQEVSVRPSAVSLNSINGIILTEAGEKRFFKTHIEPQSIIHEYYNSQILAEANYPIIQPIFSSTEWGKQLLIYEYFELTSLFDRVRQLESDPGEAAEKIIQIQQRADEHLWQIYQTTFEPIDAETHAAAPIHQLFYHRLTGGRFQDFYQDKTIDLPGKTIDFNKLSRWKWRMNGREFQHSLSELINRAIEHLNPHQEILAIVGHGDAHNGNVFVDETHQNLIYFDPAFAGRHSPFLDLAKPLFHNVFAIWLYFPEEIAQDLSLTWQLENETIVLNHTFAPTPIRLALLRSKLERVLQPLLQTLKAQNRLCSNWREFLKLALFCCPFLTMNLADRHRFPPEITLLGLAMSVEMGSEAVGDRPSLLDAELDKILDNE